MQMTNDLERIRIEMDRIRADLGWIELYNPIENKELYDSQLRLIESRIALIRTLVKYAKE
jgi:hypothetical protein